MGKTRRPKSQKSNLGYQPAKTEEEEEIDDVNSSMNREEENNENVDVALNSSGGSEGLMETILQEEKNEAVSSENFASLDDSSSDDSDLETQSLSKKTSQSRHVGKKSRSESTRSRYRRFSINSENDDQPEEQPHFDPDEDNGSENKSSYKKYFSRRKRKVVRQHYPSFKQSGYLDEFSDDDEYSLKKMEPNVETIYDIKARRRKIIFCSAVATLIAIAIVIGITTGQSEKKDEPNNNRLVAEPRSDIAEVCSKKSISTKSGHNDCVEACSHADCCTYPGVKSCFIQNEKICGMYSPCGILHSAVDGDPAEIGQITLPPPPENMEDLCSDASIRSVSGYVTCEDICRKAQCCFIEDVTSQESNPYALRSCKHLFPSICDEYQSCKSLDSSSYGLSNKEGSPVDDICAVDKVLTKQGRNACEQICQPRSCCFAKSQTRNCMKTNMKWCEEYKACQSLASTALTSNSATFLTEVSKSVVKMCSDLSMISDMEKVKCIDSCTDAKCCFSTEYTCVNIEACSQYEYCGEVLSLQNENLTGSDTSNELSISDPTKNMVDISSEKTVKQTCHPANIVSEAGLNDCINACSDFMCCFDFSEIGCSLNPQCTEYYDCIILVEYGLSTSDKNGYDIKIQVEDACNIDYIMYGKRHEACATLCEPHLCCFTGQCDTPECQEYQACGIIMNEKPKYGDSVEAIPPKEALNSIIEENVRIFCDESVLNIEDHYYWDMCEDTCKEALCCISRDGDCSDRINYCNAFSLCDLVWNGHPSTLLQEYLSNSTSVQTRPFNHPSVDLSSGHEDENKHLKDTNHPQYNDTNPSKDSQPEALINATISPALLPVNSPSFDSLITIDDDLQPEDFLSDTRAPALSPALLSPSDIALETRDDDIQPEDFLSDTRAPALSPTIISPNHDSLVKDFNSDPFTVCEEGKDQEKCKATCARLECCYVKSGDNCYDDHPDECLAYLESCLDANRVRRGLRKN